MFFLLHVWVQMELCEGTGSGALPLPRGLGEPRPWIHVYKQGSCRTLHDHQADHLRSTPDLPATEHLSVRRTAPEKDPRVYFAAERMFLAWIRTGLGLMGVGCRSSLRSVSSAASRQRSTHYDPRNGSVCLVGGRDALDAVCASWFAVMLPETHITRRTSVRSGVHDTSGESTAEPGSHYLI